MNEKVWHKFSEEKPAKDGTYVCVLKYGKDIVVYEIRSLMFFKESGCFNRKLEDEEDLEIKPIYWAYTADLLPNNIQ